MTFPISITTSQTLFEISFKGTTITPLVLTIALRKSIYKLTNIVVSITISLLTLPMFQSIFKSTNVAIAIIPRMHTLAIRQTSPPLPIIALILFLLFSVLEGKVVPIEQTSAVFFVILKLTDVQIAIMIYFNALASLLVQFKSTLVHMT